MRLRHERTRLGVHVVQHRSQRSSSFVIADGGDERARRTGRTHILSDVRGAAERVRPLAHTDDRHGCFR